MTSERQPRGPDFVIIGGMKCMTSTLHQQFAAQPGIFMSTPKEPCYFSDDEIFHLGPQWYASLFARCEETDLCGESSTHYTKLPTYPRTIERMHAAFPDLKLIYIMRHPIDRLRSQYVHEWTQRVVQGPLEMAIDQFPQLVHYSCYSYQLAPYLTTFGPTQVLPVFFDRLVADTSAEFARICEFIGYRGRPTWRTDLAADNVSEHRLRVSPWRDRLTYAPGVNWIRRTLIPQGVRDRIKQRWQMKTKPIISLARLTKLQAIFDEDLMRLGDWLGIQLSCERFREVTSANTLSWRAGLDASIPKALLAPEVAL